MKTKPRTEWNGLPGYLASLRLPGTGIDADLKHLELGFDADTIREFMKEPVAAITKKLVSKGAPIRHRGEEELNELVIKMILIGVMAERERVVEEEKR